MSGLLWGVLGLEKPVGGPGDPLCSVGFGGICGSGHCVDMCWGEPQEEVRPGVTPAATHSGTDLGGNGVGGSEDPVGPLGSLQTP